MQYFDKKNLCSLRSFVSKLSINCRVIFAKCLAYVTMDLIWKAIRGGGLSEINNRRGPINVAFFSKMK